jgi:hypothetical protein
VAPDPWDQVVDLAGGHTVHVGLDGLVGYRTAFTTGNAQNVARQSLEWIVREQDAAGSPLQGAYAAIAAVYQGSEGDLTDVAQRMARPPRRAGLDPHVTRAFASSVASARGLLRRQNARSSTTNHSA